MTDAAPLLRAAFDRAVAAARPDLTLSAHLPCPDRFDRVFVLGAGKASCAMARAVGTAWPDRALDGLILTRYGHGLACGVEVIEAGHPVPDTAGLDGTRRLMDLARGAGPDDLVLFLISGGGSALLAAPPPGLDLAALQRLSRALLASGAAIGEMNAVRRHLSAVAGGRLAALAAPATQLTLAISDVPGDAPAVIASGPTVPSPTGAAEARRVLHRYGLLDPTLDAVLDGIDPAPSGDAACFQGHPVRLVATPQASLEAAAEAARAQGVPAHILSDRIEGEARDVGLAMAAIARQVAARGQPFAPPCLLLSGGETTVTVRGQGTGGRNLEFLLALFAGLDGLGCVHALACDTDGIDGTCAAAGGMFGPPTWHRAQELGLSARQALDANDAYGFFKALDALVVTGPTHTNVNDFRAILVTADGP